MSLFAVERILHAVFSRNCSKFEFSPRGENYRLMFASIAYETANISIGGKNRVAGCRFPGKTSDAAELLQRFEGAHYFHYRTEVARDAEGSAHKDACGVDFALRQSDPGRSVG